MGKKEGEERWERGGEGGTREGRGGKREEEGRGGNPNQQDEAQNQC